MILEDQMTERVKKLSEQDNNNKPLALVPRNEILKKYEPSFKTMFNDDSDDEIL